MEHAPPPQTHWQVKSMSAGSYIYIYIYFFCVFSISAHISVEWSESRRFRVCVFLFKYTSADEMMKFGMPGARR